MQVRANSLQELVYKQGQAGVTKATVSILFDNSDKENSPVGYEHFDEITVTRQLIIGGRNKYLINGKTAEATYVVVVAIVSDVNACCCCLTSLLCCRRVQNLFHSVQLNVNNPHFLIMQGRITKVLNMKPPEILGLLEEAAGTKMYETKKQAALRTLQKKQVKVDEINKVGHYIRKIEFKFVVLTKSSLVCSRFSRKTSCQLLINFGKKRSSTWNGRMQVLKWSDSKDFVLLINTRKQMRKLKKCCRKCCQIYQFFLQCLWWECPGC